MSRVGLGSKCGSTGHRLDGDLSCLDTRQDSWSGTEAGSASGRQVVGLRYRYGVGGRIVGDRRGRWIWKPGSRRCIVVPMWGWRTDGRGQAGSGYQGVGSQGEDDAPPREQEDRNREQEVDVALWDSGWNRRSGTGRFGNR